MEFEVNIVGQDTEGALPFNFADSQNEGSVGSPFAMPYRCVFSLGPLIRKIESLAEGGDAGAKLMARTLLTRLERYPELRKPQPDPSVLKQHEKLLELFTLFLVPPTETDEALFKISVPFQISSVFESKAMHRLIDTGKACLTFGNQMEEAVTSHFISVGCTILRNCYGVDINMMPSPILTVPDARTGLHRHYRPTMNEDYAEVIPVGELPELSGQDIHRLLTNVTDRELWLELLPPEKFEFHGFHFARMEDITTSESLSRLKHRLISRDAVLDVERVEELADLIRIHFGRPDLRLGLTAVDFPADRSVDHEYRIRYNLLCDRVEHLTDKTPGSFYERAFTSGEMVLIEDITAIPNPTELEKMLLSEGLCSILLAPLLNQEKEVIGLLELAAPSAYGITAFMKNDLREIRSLFRTAVERSREYIDNRIEAIVREQYTSLHSSIEWRFTKAAYNFLSVTDTGEKAIPEKIKFREVYPLYAQADIVGSSNLRNYAIYQDLFDNLKAGRFFLTRALDLVSFPLVQQVLLSLDEFLAIPAEAFDNSDELTISDFIHQQITPLVRQLGLQREELLPLSKEYLDALDTELGLFYRVRRDYEASVTQLNRAMGELLTERNEAAQEALPHYFEMYKTDGVEYEIYAGQSLLKNKLFSDIFLRNLRLSQLIDVCELARLVQRKSTELPMPLRTAQLVFAYGAAVDISFRMDEKRFDVDGDYNVRYEILKKRIDKATVGEGRERLTQDGMVSIVYLQDKDLEEYDKYIQYLHQAGYVDGQEEHLVLDPLQSVSGLRAIRFRVKV